jgi:hypothetical protein
MKTELNNYFGNANLKGANVTIDWTPEMVSEWIKCKNDPMYFGRNYIKIISVDGGLVTIDPYDYQEEIVRKFEKSRKLVVVASRQCGKTTTATLIVLHYILFNSYKRVALLANKRDSAMDILDRIQIAFEGLPYWLQQGVVSWNKQSVELENGSRVIAAATSSSAIRGKSINLLYLDETAFIDNWNEFSASVLPTISSGKTTKLLYTSTPNGLNHFYKTVMGAKDKSNGFELVEVPWYKVPGRDEAWKKTTMGDIDNDAQKFEQEYSCVTGDTIVTVKDKSTGEIKNITIEELYVNNYEILTHEGFKPFDGIKRSLSNSLVFIETTSGKKLKCTSDHLICIGNEYVTADSLAVSDTILTKDGVESIKIKKCVNEKQYVYDVLEVKDTNSYYTNDIISHNCEFQGSSGTLISGSKLKELVPLDPIVSKDSMSMYVKYEKEHQYVCICDVSRGKGLDYSAFSIIDITQMPYKQVLTFKDNMITPTEYAETIFRTCKLYGECVVLVEINDIGQQVSDTLHDTYEYENILYTESAGRSGKRISSGFGKGADSGIRTTKTVKAVGCNMLKLMIEQNQLIVNDIQTIEELSRFSRKGLSFEAESGCNDDLVMTLVLFGWLSDQQYFKDLTNINTLANLREKSEDDLMSELTPFGVLDDGLKEEVIYEGREMWTVVPSSGELY